MKPFKLYNEVIIQLEYAVCNFITQKTRSGVWLVDYQYDHIDLDKKAKWSQVTHFLIDNW